MFINKIQSTFTYLDKSGLRKQGVRTTMYGKLYNGDSITVDNYIKDGKTVEKRFVIFNDFMQKIINKGHKPDGNGFERIG